MQAIVTPAKYYLADYNLGEIKHQAMFAGGRSSSPIIL